MRKLFPLLLPLRFWCVRFPRLPFPYEQYPQFGLGAHLSENRPPWRPTVEMTSGVRRMARRMVRCTWTGTTCGNEQYPATRANNRDSRGTSGLCNGFLFLAFCFWPTRLGRQGGKVLSADLAGCWRRAECGSCSRPCEQARGRSVLCDDGCQEIRGDGRHDGEQEKRKEERGKGMNRTDRRLHYRRRFQTGSSRDEGGRAAVYRQKSTTETPRAE